MQILQYDEVDTRTDMPTYTCIHNPGRLKMAQLMSGLPFEGNLQSLFVHRDLNDKIG
jgi:hypothetical protein